MFNLHSDDTQSFVFPQQFHVRCLISIEILTKTINKSNRCCLCPMHWPTPSEKDADYLLSLKVLLESRTISNEVECLVPYAYWFEITWATFMAATESINSRVLPQEIGVTNNKKKDCKTS